jgi:hypothetical protein
MTTSSDRVAVGRFDTVVLDCPDPRALAEFYAGLLGAWVRKGQGARDCPCVRPRPLQTVIWAASR